MGVGIGVNRYRSDRSNFVSALVEIGLLESIAAETLREPCKAHSWFRSVKQARAE
jgi:hypothetical protein